MHMWLLLWYQWLSTFASWFSTPEVIGMCSFCISRHDIMQKPFLFFFWSINSHVQKCLSLFLGFNSYETHFSWFWAIPIDYKRLEIIFKILELICVQKCIQYLVCKIFRSKQGSPCRQNQNHLHSIVEISAHTLKAMEQNPHKLWSANDHIPLGTSSNGKKISAPEHCI